MALLKSEVGSVVFNAAVAGEVGLAGLSLYSASKGASSLWPARRR